MIVTTVGSKTDADLWLLNSCTVKNPAEDHFRNEIKLAQTLDKKVVVAGCVPQGERKSGYLQVATIHQFIVKPGCLHFGDS